MAHTSVTQLRTQVAIPVPKSSDNMTRSPSSEPVKPTSKRKGTRSVSTLSPSQLARKRANDREAQRAIRARTKEHIERLEQEIEDLRCKQDRDETVRELMKKNQALEKELMALRESVGIPPPPGSSYRSPVYGDNIQMANPEMQNRNSPFQHSSDYHRVGDYQPSYIPTSDPSPDSWSTNMPVSVSSTVSSPASSASTTDDYGYIPTSVPPPTIDGSAVPPSSMPIGMKEQVEYDEMDSDTNGYSPTHTVPIHPIYPHQQGFSMFPQVYYPQSPTI